MCKFDEYDNMLKGGISSAITYLLIFIFIIALIPATFVTYNENKSLDEFKSYLSETLPELTFSNNKLKIDDEGSYILDDDKVTDILKYNIVLNTNILDVNDVKEEYSALVTDEIKCAVFEEDKIQLLSYKEDDDADLEKEIQVTDYTYEQYASKYIKDTSKEYNKEEIINHLGSSSIVYYFTIYYLKYFIILTFILGINLIIVETIAIVILKFNKVLLKSKEMYSVAIYASTLGNIIYAVYLIFSYITSISLKFVGIINYIVTYIYIKRIVSDKKQKKREK